MFVNQIKSSLYQNAFILILTNLTASVSGFVFWFIAARFYSAEDVGIATVIISAMNLIALLSKVGLDFGLMRFISEFDTEGRIEVVNSSLTVTIIISTLASVIFLSAAPNIISEELKILKLPLFALLFIALVVIVASLQTTYGLFIGLRKAKFCLIQNVTWSCIKAVIVGFLSFLGVYGIILSWGIGVLVAIAVVLIYLIPRLVKDFRPRFELKLELIKKLITFSVGNQVATLFNQLPTLLLPMIVVNALGSKYSAYFYISWMIANFLFFIPNASGFSFVAESVVNNENVRTNLLKSMIFTYILLSVGILFIYVFGYDVLKLFGDKYVYAFNLLEVLALSSLVVAPNVIYINLERVRRRVKPIVLVNGIIAFTTVIGSALLAKEYGLIVIGYIYTFANILSLIVILLLILMKRFYYSWMTVLITPNT